jgi:hypothetical protein
MLIKFLLSGYLLFIRPLTTNNLPEFLESTKNPLTHQELLRCEVFCFPYRQVPYL